MSHACGGVKGERRAHDRKIEKGLKRGRARTTDHRRQTKKATRAEDVYGGGAHKMPTDSESNRSCVKVGIESKPGAKEKNDREKKRSEKGNCSFNSTFFPVFKRFCYYL